MDTQTLPARRDIVLDFWRGLGVLLVLMHHLVYFHFEAFRSFLSSSPIGVLEHFLWVADLALVEFSERAGPIGVKLFFIVSGYIITLLMVREEEKYGHLSVGAFYMRRIFRILPPYFFYLLGIITFSLVSWISVPASDVLNAGAFLCNTAFSCGWFVIHTWTLAIEMQFYFFWPLLFIFLPITRRASFLTILLAFLALSSMLTLFVTHGWIDNALSFACIALGALCAVQPSVRNSLEKRGLVYIGIIALMIVVVYAVGFTEVSRVIYRTSIPIILAALIFSSYRFKWFINTRIFKGISGVGLVSYSLYLWQQVFAAPSGYYLAPSPLQYVFLVIVFCLFSYYFVERPFIRFGKILQQRYASYDKV